MTIKLTKVSSLNPLAGWSCEHVSCCRAIVYTGCAAMRYQKTRYLISATGDKIRQSSPPDLCDDEFVLLLLRKLTRSSSPKKAAVRILIYFRQQPFKARGFGQRFIGIPLQVTSQPIQPPNLSSFNPPRLCEWVFRLPRFVIVGWPN